MTTPVDRAHHIKQSIGRIRDGLDGLSLNIAQDLGLPWSGFLYELLVISEASRHLPDQWKSEFGEDIDWRQMADLGNRLTHHYHRSNISALWSIYVHDLDPLEAAIDAILAAHDTD